MHAYLKVFYSMKSLVLVISFLPQIHIFSYKRNTVIYSSLYIVVIYSHCMNLLEDLRVCNVNYNFEPKSVNIKYLEIILLF